MKDVLNNAYTTFEKFRDLWVSGQINCLLSVTSCDVQISSTLQQEGDDVFVTSFARPVQGGPVVGWSRHSPNARVNF